MGIPTIPGCRRDRSRRRRDHFTCEFIGAGPHTPFGNYNNIPGGSGDVLEVGCGKILGEVMFWRWGVGRFLGRYLVYLALYPWMSSKWGLWTAHVFQALCLRHGACKSAVSSFHSCRAMPLALGFSALTWSHSKRSMS